MVKDGYIEITDKVRFVYYELKKPDLDNFKKHPVWAYAEYDKALKAYEASKRTIEVSNAKKCENNDKNGDVVCVIFIDTFEDYFVKNNQPCKAKVNSKAEIIELLRKHQPFTSLPEKPESTAPWH